MPRFLAAAGALLLGFALINAGSNAGDAFDPVFLRQEFARPTFTPDPPDNLSSPTKVALGAALFEDPRLSGSGGIACATCHQADLAFADGTARRQALKEGLLDRHVPSLWNIAWGLSWFWDGRASSLEAQVAGPIENPREMDGDLEKIIPLLQKDTAMRKAFAQAFPEDPQVTRTGLLKALAAFERSLVSPTTRFDRWVAGDNSALDETELAGFKLFVGKAACVSCHKGWRFTDEAFHDIGLPDADLGRGRILGVKAADHAFKTPSLRERIWSAPYMHDGSLDTLEDVVTHYGDRIVERPSLSADLRRITLSKEERSQLVTFLATLSSEDPPRPASLPSKTMVAGTVAPGVATTSVGQKDRRFTPSSILMRVGEALKIVNDDIRVHNVRIEGPGLTYNSDGQNPGDVVTVGFDRPGRYEAICGIHPEMHLSIDVKQR